eukprot:119727_1
MWHPVMVKEQKSLKLTINQQKSKCEEKASSVDDDILSVHTESDEDVLNDPLDTTDTRRGKKRTLDEYINTQMNPTQTPHERLNKRRRIDNDEEQNMNEDNTDGLKRMQTQMFV